MVEIKLECSCGNTTHLSFDYNQFKWTIIDTDERELGMQTTHISSIDVHCPHCNKNLKITFELLEYPEGDVTALYCQTDDKNVKCSVNQRDIMESWFHSENRVS